MKKLVFIILAFALLGCGVVYRVDSKKLKSLQSRILTKFHEDLNNGLPVRLDGFCYAIDLAEIMRSSVEVGDSALFSKAYNILKKYYIVHDSWIDSAVVWRYKPGFDIDASGTAETIYCAYAIFLAYKKWKVDEYKKVSYSLARAYLKHGFMVDGERFLVKNYFNYKTRTLSENTYLINQRPDFLFLIGRENGDSDMVAKVKLMYNGIIAGYVKNGFFYPLYDVGVKTIIPGSSGYHSPDAVFPLLSSIDIALSIFEFNQRPANEILKFFEQNFGKWEDHYVLNDGKFKPISNRNSTSLAIYSQIIEIFMLLGKPKKYKDLVRYIVGDLFDEKINEFFKLTPKSLDSFYFELAIALRTLHKVIEYGI